MPGSDYVKRIVKSYADIDSKYYDGQADDPQSDEISRCYSNELKALIGDGKKKILDVGSGTGYISILLARLGHEVTGIDISKAMLSISTKKARKMELDIEFLEADAENLPFKDGSFDAVISRHVIWTLPDPEKAIKSWAGAVKQNGEMIVIDGGTQARGMKSLARRPYCIYRMAREGRTINELINYEYPRDVRIKIPNINGITGEKIACYMRRAGIRDITIKDAVHLNEMAIKGKPRYERFFYKTFFDFHTYIVSGVTVSTE